VVVGTLYKQMQLKPSILEEYSKEVGVIVNSFSGFFCCQNAFVLRFFLLSVCILGRVLLIKMLS
jgi:hypothetical protein